MNTLVERTIEAHGGLKRWNELESVTAHLDEDGALWGLKGHPAMLGETNVTVGTQSEWASHHPFLAARARTRFEPHRIALESENGALIEELKQPRASFAGHGLETPWSKLQLAYFAGYAMWTYLNLPFLLGGKRRDVESPEDPLSRGRRYAQRQPDSLHRWRGSAEAPRLRRGYFRRDTGCALHWRVSGSRRNHVSDQPCHLSSPTRQHPKP
jgi:hypothetical protein